ncbi:hypothetical protein [Bordetella tumulicola]|uniref:hypothetical protein n=1 Tax=Bordetella tumulicola TaxID=1649133 RepID=UPI0039EFE7D0
MRCVGANGALTPGAHPFGARLRLRAAAACAPAIDPHYAPAALADARHLCGGCRSGFARKLPVQA